MIPRQDRNEQGDRDDIEGNDPPRHVAHRRRNAARGVGGLPRCKTDDLRSLKIDEDNDHRECDAPVPIRRKAAAAEQDVRPDIALIADEPETDEEGDHAERNERSNLDEREPELTLAKFIDTKQIEDGDDQPEEDCPPDRPDLGEKTIHDDAGGDHLRGHIGDPCHPVRPSDPTRPGRGDVLARIDNERAGERFFDRQLGEAEHDCEDDDAPEEIGNHGGRSRLLEHIARSEEVSAPDHAAERDKLKMSVLQLPFHSRFAHGLSNTTFLPTSPHEKLRSHHTTRTHRLLRFI